MEPKPDTKNPDQKEAGTSMQEVKCKVERGQKTLRRNREVFRKLHQKLLDAESLHSFGGDHKRGLLRAIVEATKRAFNNMAALKFTLAQGEKTSSPGACKGPVIIEGVNPILDVFHHAVKLFMKEVAYSQQFYPRETKHYFRFPISTILHQTADAYTRCMQVEFDCFTAPIRHPPAEGINYLNLRDTKRLWELPHHQLFLDTMLKMCKEVGRDKMDRHDLNLFMHGKSEALKMFRFVVDPEAGDYVADEVVLYAVSCAVQKWGTVLLEVTEGSGQTVRIPVLESRLMGLLGSVEGGLGANLFLGKS